MKRIRITVEGFTYKTVKQCHYRYGVWVGSIECGDCEYYLGTTINNYKKGNYKLKIKCGKK